MSQGQTHQSSNQDTVSQDLKNMAQDAASVEADSTGGFMKPGVEAKRKRGRPKKEDGRQSNSVGGDAKGPSSQAGGIAGQSPDNTATYKQILSPVWETISHVAVQITGESEAGMKPLEAQLITDSSAACVQQYMPDALGRHANLVLFLASMGTWSGRVYLIYLAKKEMIEAQKAHNARPANQSNGAAGPQVMAQ